MRNYALDLFHLMSSILQTKRQTEAKLQEQHILPFVCVCSYFVFVNRNKTGTQRVTPEQICFLVTVLLLQAE